MIRSDAAACIAKLVANWPNPKLPIETVLEWEAHLLDRRFSVSDWTDAIRLLFEQARMFAPHASEVADIAEELWRDRVATSTPALPPAREPSSDYISFRDWLDTVATPAQRALAAKHGLTVLEDA